MARQHGGGLGRSWETRRNAYLLSSLDERPVPSISVTSRPRSGMTPLVIRTFDNKFASKTVKLNENTKRDIRTRATHAAKTRQCYDRSLLRYYADLRARIDITSLLVMNHAARANSSGGGSTAIAS